MDEIELHLAKLQSCLVKNLELASLLPRNPVAHRWKVTFQNISLREALAWRTVDLLSQSWFLHKATYSLGARILLRSALETAALLMYLNYITESVVKGDISFEDYQEKITRLMQGSKNGSTNYSSINIITILDKCNDKYSGIMNLYASLSETAHPNFEGVTFAYSEFDKSKLSTTFCNKNYELYASGHADGILIVIAFLDTSYNDWVSSFEFLEEWLENNSAKFP